MTVTTPASQAVQAWPIGVGDVLQASQERHLRNGARTVEKYVLVTGYSVAMATGRELGAHYRAGLSGHGCPFGAEGYGVYFAVPATSELRPARVELVDVDPAEQDEDGYAVHYLAVLDAETGAMVDGFTAAIDGEA